MSDLVPEGWSVEALDSVTKVIDSAHQTPVFSSSGYPMVRVGDIKGGRINLAGTASVSTEVFDVFTKKYQPQYNDILMTRVGSYGRSSIVKTDKAFCLGQNTVVVNPKSIDADYLYQFLQGQNAKDQIEDTVGGSSQKSLSLGAIKNLKVPISPLSEQKKIASILTSVDDVIEKTQAQIDKLKDLKTGMMQELLTSGVGVDGKPHTEFKDSPVGRIPKGWDVTALEDLASFVTSGSRGWAQYYSDSGAIFIRIGNLTREHINFRFKDTIYVNPPNTAEGKRTLVQTGDVLISITADLGVIAVVNDDIGEAYVNQHVSLVRLKDKSISRWVGHFLAYEESQKQFTANNDSGAKAGLNLTAIKRTKIAIPPVEEMKKIVHTLDAVDRNIAIKRQKLSKVSDTKKALMQDLLTGKVRVKVDS